MPASDFSRVNGADFPSRVFAEPWCVLQNALKGGDEQEKQRG